MELNGLAVKKSCRYGVTTEYLMWLSTPIPKQTRNGRNVHICSIEDVECEDKAVNTDYQNEALTLEKTLGEYRESLKDSKEVVEQL